MDLNRIGKEGKMVLFTGVDFSKTQFLGLR